MGMAAPRVLGKSLLPTRLHGFLDGLNFRLHLTDVRLTGPHLAYELISVVFPDQIRMEFAVRPPFFLVLVALSLGLLVITSQA